MKIIVHPSYDGGYFVEGLNSFAQLKHDMIIGTKIVGTLGLLEHLALSNGLSGRFSSDGERAASYLAHVAECVEGTIIEESFKNDGLGVAKCLLGWRDVLIMAGWLPLFTAGEKTPKLQLLAHIEALWQAKLKGVADRWLELLELSKKQSIINGNDVIECRIAKDRLPRLLQEVLVACGASFADSDDVVEIPDSLSIGIEHYNDLMDAYRHVAANIDDYKDVVIINRDNVSLNHVLCAWGKPMQDAEISSSNTQALQFFKLAMSVFSRPLNIYNILSYLQLPVGPVPRRLRFALARVLLRNGGFGEIEWDELQSHDYANELKDAGIESMWDKEIYDYINNDDLIPGSSKTKRKAKADFLLYITDPSITSEKPISVNVLTDYIMANVMWANTIINADDEMDEALKVQLSQVVSFFKQLAAALVGVKEIMYEDLEKHVRTIYEPTSMPQARAQVGALQVITSCEQMVDAPQSLVWLDCCDAEQLSDPYEFLSAAERQWLNAQEGVVIPSVQELLELRRREMIAAIARVKGSVVLVTSDYHHNKKLAEHPLVAELKMKRGERLTVMEGSTALTMSEEKEVKTLEPKMQYELGMIDVRERSESNTSLDTLINYPFDYTVRYVAQLGEASEGELSGINVYKGLVAHSFIKNLVNRAKNLADDMCVAKMREILNEQFDEMLNCAIRATGLLLYLKENEVEYNIFRYQLKRSLESLIAIMQQKELTPVGCEMKFVKPIDDNAISRFNARIDMVLKDKDGRAVIFDFKWSYSSYYGKKIEEGNAVQLELYRQELMAEGWDVSAVGYYLMPKCVLETSDFESLHDEQGGVIINHLNATETSDVFERIKNSVVFRRNEIAKGFIEEGEEENIIEMPYSCEYLNDEGKPMMLVGEKKNNRKKELASIEKKSPRVFRTSPQSRFVYQQNFSNDNTPSNEKPTTYPLMKGRLK